MSVHFPDSRKESVYIVQGVTVYSGEPHPYIGLGSGLSRSCEYRIYADRTGWFVAGEFAATPPTSTAAARIRSVFDPIGPEPFLDVLLHGTELWKLKEKLGL